MPFVDVDFCMYSDWGYRKRTRIWTNFKDFDGKTCDRKCGNMDSSGKKHRLLQRKGKGVVFVCVYAKERKRPRERRRDCVTYSSERREDRHNAPDKRRHAQRHKEEHN